ncbi:MAG: LytTR family DNA-binding domain-containing protein [Acidobacteriota bacterium]
MTTVATKLRAYLVDDEPLALKRLTRLLTATGRVEIVGSTSDPEVALESLTRIQVELLFLDIEMPAMNGFELLAQLPLQPLVVFTTAYDQYALQAFEVNSIDYLLKPVEMQQLERVLAKFERLHSSTNRSSLSNQFQSIFEQLATTFRVQPEQFLTVVASRLGERIQLIEVATITHFFAKDKLTYAVADKDYVIDYTIAQLEEKLAPKTFLRIHRATIVNLAYVHELSPWFAGRLAVRLKDTGKTQLIVARDRVPALKERLGL